MVEGESKPVVSSQGVPASLISTSLFSPFEKLSLSLSSALSAAVSVTHAALKSRSPPISLTMLVVS